MAPQARDLELELCRALRLRKPELPIVFTSGHVDPSFVAVELTGAYRFLPKPYAVDELVEAVHALLYRDAATGAPTP